MAGVYLSEAPYLLVFVWGGIANLLVLNLVKSSLQHNTPLSPSPSLSVLIHREGGKGGGWGELERRLEVHEFTKLGIKYQHD